MLSAPLVAEGQQAGKLYRIGYLGVSPPSAATAFMWEAFLQGLRDHGYVEGQNLVIERRWSEGKAERFPDLVAELVRLNVDLIVAPTTPAARAAKQVTGTTPIVTVLAGDPVAVGLVSSLARPGGNVTGLTGQATDWSTKPLQLLTEAIPGATRVGILWNPTNPAHIPGFKQVERAAAALRVQIQSLEVRTAGDLDGAFSTVTRDRPDALAVFDDPITFVNRQRIVDFAARTRLPAAYAFRWYVDVGGLMAFSPNLADLFRRSGTYIDKILRGARPADLPVEQPTKFEFVINLKTAKALGLTIPQSVLLRADQVIE
jgi:putative tryptophan/tyrosine transport system substrate-binding protein